VKGFKWNEFAIYGILVESKSNVSESKIWSYYKMYLKTGSFGSSLEYEIAKAEIIGTRTISRRFGEKFRSIHSSYAPKNKGW
jgi:hypothetical protein